MKASTTFIRKTAKKLKLIRLMGGKCVTCGLDLSQDPAIADFHHTDMTTKEVDPTVALCWTWERTCAEIKDKCVILCRNCHGKLHYRYDLLNDNREEIERLVAQEKEPQSERGLSHNPEVANEVLRLHSEGHKIRRIAIMLGISRSPVKTILIKNGIREQPIHTREERSRLMKEVMGVNVTKEQLQTYLAQGLFAREIADKIGCSRATITTLIKQHGLFLVNGHKVNQANVEEAKRLKATGQSLRQIALHMKVHMETIRRWLTEQSRNYRHT